MGAELGAMQPPAKTQGVAGHHQKLGERHDSPLGPREESTQPTP